MGDCEISSKRKSVKFVIKTLLMGVAFVLFVCILMTILAKYTLSYVVTNSMYPTIPESSYIIMEKYNGGNIEVDDIIIYVNDYESKVVHRVVEISTDETGEVCYKTKGDNNDLADSGVRYKIDIIGKLAYIITKQGFIGNIIDIITSNSKVVMVSIIACFSIMCVALLSIKRNK